MRVPETGRPKTVSLFSSTINRPPRATEIFEVPVEAFASAFGCATNFTVLVYSPARFARNSCSGPGLVASGVWCVSGAASGFCGDWSWAKTVATGRSNSAASKALRPHSGARFIDISLRMACRGPKNGTTYGPQNIAIGRQAQLRSGLAQLLARALVFFNFAVAQTNYAVCVGRDIRFVRDQDDGIALLVQTCKKRHDFFARLRVEIPGGLINQKNRGLVDESARDGHTLPLTA